MKLSTHYRSITACVSFTLVALICIAADQKDETKKTVPQIPPDALSSPIAKRWDLVEQKIHRDFPVLALDANGVPWVAYIEHDGKSDVLKLARKAGAGLETLAAISTPGIVHQPAVAVAHDGSVWCFWGQVDTRDIVTLRARRYLNGTLEAETVLASSDASDTFADAGTDHAGRVWVTWQSLRRGQGDIFTRWLEPKTQQWSKEISISKPEGGNWEPRLAFTAQDGAWIVFDSSRGGEFNIYLAQVGLEGTVKELKITDTPEYEARASITAAKDGKSLWISGERGRRGWGLDMRGHEGEDSLNGQKRLIFGNFDIATNKFSEIAVPMNGKLAPRAEPSPRLPAFPKVKIAPRSGMEVNLPALATDAGGNPWLAWRYYFENRWLIAVTRFVAATGVWSLPKEIPDSSFGQDRHAALARSGNTMLLCWPSDLRDSKKVLTAGVYLAELATEFSPLSEPISKIALLPEREPYLNTTTPERPRTEHDVWRVGDKQYTLLWGDLHRHTDFSNCRTGQDGCIVEHFRYATDMAALDFLGTSDHTDIVKKYDPYEWWQTSRLVDVFYIPKKFISLYAYEREQVFPWGHRNIVFAQRGGPIVYVKRKAYQESQWNDALPVKDGEAEITPMELWDVLKRYGHPVAAISHTGATGMGTDWDKYEQIDNSIENVVEIFQGARVSYEGLGAPQPTVGLRVGEPYTPSNKAKDDFVKPPGPITDFGAKFNNGVYQRALADGHKLGVFASSDHVSQHTSFGGVYVEKVTREGIIDAFKARRTIAATDKIFVHLTCNGQPLGSIITTTGTPTLTLSINGTAALKRVTIVRNEQNYHVFEPGQKTFADTFTDTAPIVGENRYYLRVEQADGNMAWSSPVWVTVTK